MNSAASSATGPGPQFEVDALARLTAENPMANKQSFSDSIYAAETHGAAHELSAFIGAVTELFGPEQARVSTEDWLDELTLIDTLSLSIKRNWRAVTIAAAARLANRLNTSIHRHIYSSVSTDTKVSPSDCASPVLLL